MKKQLALFFVALLIGMAAPRLSLAQGPLYTNGYFASINNNWVAPCGQSGNPTAQLKAALSQMPNGGTLDLTCYGSAIILNQDIFSTVAAPVTLILPPVVVTVNANATIPSNFQICARAGGSIVAGATFTLTNNASTCDGITISNYYQTVEANGTAKPQQPTLNLIQGANMGVACVNNVGSSRTDCTLTSSATVGTAFSALTASTNSNSGTFAASGNVWDFSGATSLAVPSSATPTGAGLIGYDTVNNRFVGGNGTNTSFLAWLIGTPPTSGHLAVWSGTLGQLADGGAVPSASIALSGLTSATAAHTLANGVNAQTWNWALASTGNTGITFGETTAAASGGEIVNIVTLPTSTAVPLTVTNAGASTIAANLSAGGLAFTGNLMLDYPNAGGDVSSLALGVLALSSQNANSKNNLAIGYNSLGATTSGNTNTAVGFAALPQNITHSNNTAVGYSALGAVNASGNTGVGYNVLNSTTSGASNTALGISSGVTNITGADNTYVGANADASGNAYSNSFAVGYQAAVNASNIGVLGNSSVTDIYGGSITGAATFHGTFAGNATTAANLASYPSGCTGGQFSQGLSSGSNNCASPAGSGTVTSSGTPAQYDLPYWTTSTNLTKVTAPATAGFYFYNEHPTTSAAVAPTMTVSTALPAGFELASLDTGNPSITWSANTLTFAGALSTGSQITSTLATGTAPFAVASTTPVANLSIGGNAATATAPATAPWGVAVGGTGTTTAFTSGSAVYAGSSGVYSQDNANFFYNPTGYSSAPTLQIGPVASDPIDAVLEVYNASNSNTIDAHNTATQGSTGGGIIRLIAAPPGAAIASGSRLGSLQFGGANDTAQHISSVSFIRAFATQSWTAGAALGSNLTFGTTANSTTTTSTALTFDQDQSAQFSPGSRVSGSNPYFQLQIPTDTGLTNATEAPGFKTLTATRTFTNTAGTVTVQRENLFAGPTYAAGSNGQTITDAATVGITPPVQGANATITRDHSLVIVDSTSAASPVTGGLVVAATLGTAATSVGIGGGNVKAGGDASIGGTLGVTGLTTATGGVTVPSGGTLTMSSGSSLSLVAASVTDAALAAPADLGAITWNNGGNCTFAAASHRGAGATLTTVTGQSCTLVVTNPVKWGSYYLEVDNGSGAAATVTLGACASGAFKVGGGGAGAITLSGASGVDYLAFTFNGTNCMLNFRTNFN